MTSEFDFLNEYRLLMRLHAESAGLEWGKDSTRIRSIGEESERRRRGLNLPKRDSSIQIGGFYRDAEELCSVWIAGEVQPCVFAFHLLDYVVRDLDAQSCFNLCTLDGAVGAYGCEFVEQLFDLADAAMESIDVTWRRYETTEFDEQRQIDVPLFAGLNDADERFDEAPAKTCQPQDQGATQITIVDIDIDEFRTIGEFIEHRDALARRAARGELSAADPAHG